MRKNKERDHIRIKTLYLVLAGALLLGVVMNWSGTGLAASPAEDIKSLINEVLGILNNPAYGGPTQRSQRVELVEKAAGRHIDYREMAKQCLGDTWDSLNKAQQDEYVKNFSGLIKAGYTCRMDEFTKAKVLYGAEVLKGSDHGEVAIVILRPNDKIPVNFRMLKEPQGWMIYDLVIEGVSMVDNYRAQFARAIQAGSFQTLLQVLQQRMQEECKP